MERKVCIRCGTEKPLSDFNKSKDKKDGYRSECRKCNSEYQLEYRRTHELEISTYQHIYQIERRVRSPRFAMQTKERAPKIIKPKKVRIKKIRNKERRREYEKQWKNADIGRRIACNLRSRIWDVLMGNKKYYKFEEFVGCTLNFLKSHLESQFTEGMSWDNYGQFGWHVDHKKPCNAFDFKDPSQQKQCFHYSNLQPLWWKENIIKSNKIIW